MLAIRNHEPIVVVDRRVQRHDRNLAQTELATAPPDVRCRGAKRASTGGELIDEIGPSTKSLRDSLRREVVLGMGRSPVETTAVTGWGAPS